MQSDAEKLIRTACLFGQVLTSVRRLVEKKSERERLPLGRATLTFDADSLAPSMFAVRWMAPNGAVTGYHFEPRCDLSDSAGTVDEELAAWTVIVILKALVEQWPLVEPRRIDELVDCLRFSWFDTVKESRG